MALDAKRLSSIYEKLVPLLGEDDANAFMSQFQVAPTADPVARQVPGADLAEPRSELRGGNAGPRGGPGEGLGE